VSVAFTNTTSRSRTAARSEFRYRNPDAAKIDDAMATILTR
jgi:hypothetical protein